MSSDQQAKLPVLVVGAGPTGLTLASELARHGVACRLIDKGAGPTPLSKATTVQARTLEALCDMGIVDEVIAAGHVSHGVNIYAGSKRISHFSYDQVESPYPFVLNIPQSGMERILGGLAARRGVSIEWGTELTGFTQDEAGVTASLRHADGSEEHVRADWLAGCDGSHSVVRHELGVLFAGHTYQQWFGLADARVHWGLSHDELHIFVHPKGAFVAIPMPGADQYRLILESDTHADDADLRLADFQAALEERGPGLGTVMELGWKTPFKVNARRAARHRVGRVFLAGDAAHIHSPVGGQGMNTGMQDAYNLAWKLALVQRGQAAPGLIESYDAERSPVAEALLKMTDRMTNVIIAQAAVTRAVRDHVMPILTGIPAVQQGMANQDAEMDINYRRSPVVAESHRGRFGQARFFGGPRAGDRAPDAGPLVRREQAVNLFNQLRGTRFKLLAFGGAEPTTATWEHLAALGGRLTQERDELVEVLYVVDGLSVPAALPLPGDVLLDPEGAAHHRYHAEEPCLYLVRPDGYIAFLSRPADEAALEHYLGSILQASVTAAS